MPKQPLPKLTRYQTRCIDCGTQLNDIDRMERQYCRCRKIYGYGGKVLDNEEFGNKDKQGALFDTAPDTTYAD
jgi:hypothetical protein